MKKQSIPVAGFRKLNHTMKFNLFLATGLLALGLGSATAAPTITLGTTVPAVGDGVQNLNFSTSSANNTTHDFVPDDYIASNVNGGEALWIGQSFTTGADPFGYELNSISVRQVSWGPTNWDFNGGEVYLRVFKVVSQDGGVFNTTELTSQTVTVAETGASNVGGTPGASAMWLTFNLDAPLLLDPSAEYVFSFKSNATIDGSTSNFLMEVDGTDADSFAGGCSTSVPDGGTVHWKGGANSDRAFVANMNVAPDSDSDNLPDWWEFAYSDPDSLADFTGLLPSGSGPGAGTGDFDGDGYSDLQEFTYGTDPGNSASSPVLTISVNYDASWSATPALAPSSTAGAVPAKNWNNVVDLNHAITFHDQANIAATGMTATLAGGNMDTWNTGGSSDEIVFGDKVNNPGSLSLGNVPYVSYDLYIYMSAFGNEVVNFSLDGGSTVAATLTNTFSPQFTGGADFVQNDTYVKLASLTGNVTVTMTATSDAAHIAGFQIVDAGAVPAIPAFRVQPVNQSAAVSRSATFTCLATAAPAPTYQWEYSADGSTGWTELTDETSPTLQLFYVDPSNEVYYRCIATNTNGSDISDVAFLDIYYAVPEFIEQPADTFAEPGSEVVISAYASTYGNPTYQWYKNGSPLEGETESTLTLTGIDASDAGDYYLRVTDDIEPGLYNDSDVATITVVDLQITSSDAAPAINGGDEAYLPAVSADGENIDAGNDAHTYIAWDRPSQGMSFTTGSDPLGYTLNAITIQQVNYDHAWADVQPGDVFQFAFGTLSGTTKTPLYQANTVLYAGDPINNGDSIGSGKFLTFDLSSAGIGTLSPNTRYYFEVAVKNGTGQFVYVEWNGASAGDYAGGEAFSGDANAAITPTYVAMTGDRAFHADLTGLSALSDDYAAWIGGFDVGGLTGFGEDPDNDGNSNGVECFFGSDPSVSTAGLVEISRNGNTVTFQHPQNATPASDVSAAYEWSTDLAAFFADGASDGSTVVGFEVSPNTPVAGTTTVNATMTGPVPAKLFVRLKVSQTP